MFQFGCCYFMIASGCTGNNNNYVGTADYESGLINIIKGNFIVSRMEIFKLNY